MGRLLSPFVLVVTALVGSGYAYLALRLAAGAWSHALLAVPFALIWLVPVYYWGRDRARPETWLDNLAHQASYLSMGWVSFALVFTIARDVLLLITLPWAYSHALVQQAGVPVVLVVSLLA